MNNLSTLFRNLNKRGTYFLKKMPIAVNCQKYSLMTTQKLKLEKENFQDVWPNLVQSITEDKKIAQLPEVATWIKKVLDYNTRGGKLFRGMTTVFAYESVEKPENMTPENLELARILGWCVEILQGYFVVLDDIMDQSLTRRGQTCWYKRPEVGLESAVNDTVFLHSTLLLAIKKHFRNHPSYSHILELFNEVLLYTAMGQYLDLTTGNSNEIDYSKFRIERVEAIAKFKTMYYTFQLPLSLGLYLANITNKDVHSQIEVICSELGRYFQMQDDYLDCYCDEAKTGKTGTDIQEGKCTWFAVQALTRCNEAQRLVFKSCYGSANAQNVATIRSLYDELGLKELYYEEQKKTAEVIEKQSELLQKTTGVPASLTTKLLDMLRGRNH